MMIENAYYIVNPPQSPAMAVVTRPPLHEYIRKLLYHDLGKNTTEKVLKQIRKLDWSDPEMAAYATGCISAVWNIKYYNIRFAASLLAGLASHHVSSQKNCSCRSVEILTLLKTGLGRVPCG